MNLTKFIGLLLAFATLIIGVYLKGSNPIVLLNPAAMVIILVGTAAALMNSYSGEDIKRIPILFKILFGKKNNLNKLDLIKDFKEWSNTVRTEGVLAIEKHLENTDNDYLKNGMQMLIDGMEKEIIQNRLETDLNNMEDRHLHNAGIFTKAGQYAPALGVLGAVIGLVSALGHLDDPEILGASISASFIATLYGIATGYIFWIPYANQLKQLSSDEVKYKEMMLDGIILLSENTNQRTMEEILVTYLSTKEKKLFLEGEINEE